MELFFITSNSGKIKEAQQILGFPVKIKKVTLPEIQSLDLTEIAFNKAKEAFKILNSPLIVDDAGLFIDAWSDFPGPFIKYIFSSGGPQLLLKMLATETNRKATFKAAIAYHNGEQIKVFTGEVKGEIIQKEKGTKGWGFDSIFKPMGSTLTFAQMPEEEKNQISHRKQALEKLKKYLSSH